MQGEALNLTESASTLTIVSDLNRLAAMHSDWDGFVDSFAPSPFFLMGLLKIDFVGRATLTKEERPLAFVMSENAEPLGLAVFRIADNYVVRKPRVFRFRSAEFLLRDELNPDFVVRPERREKFVEGVMSLLFGKLGCRSARLTLPSGSPNAPFLRRWCEKHGLAIRSFPHSRHAILKVEGSWDDYLRSRRRCARSQKRSEQAITALGGWSLSSGRVESQAIVDKIMEVDRNSWKQEWRSRGINVDQDLRGILNYYRYAPTSRFRPLFWLLELDDRPVAFDVAIILGRVAYCLKTSYDERYRGLSPGIFVTNFSFRDLFQPKEVSKLDFLTFLDYMRRWTSESLTRETFVIGDQKGPSRLQMALRRNKISAWFFRALTRQRLTPVPRVGTLEDDDSDQIIAIETASFPNPIPRATFEWLKQKPEGKFIVARREGRVVGYALLKVQGDRAHILSTAVATDCRRIGIGEAILRKSVDKSVYAVRVKRVSLDVRPSNAAMLCLCRKLSFRETGNVRKKFYPDGEDAIEMERTL